MIEKILLWPFKLVVKLCIFIVKCVVDVLVYAAREATNMGKPNRYVPFYDRDR